MTFYHATLTYTGHEYRVLVRDADNDHTKQQFFFRTRRQAQRFASNPKRIHRAYTKELRKLADKQPATWTHTIREHSTPTPTPTPDIGQRPTPV